LEKLGYFIGEVGINPKVFVLKLVILGVPKLLEAFRSIIEAKGEIEKQSCG
jgi:hypothetical protein